MTSSSFTRTSAYLVNTFLLPQAARGKRTVTCRPTAVCRAPSPAFRRLIHASTATTPARVPALRRSAHTSGAAMGGEQVCKDGVCYVDFSKKKEKPDDAPAGGGKFDAAEHVRGLLDRHRVLVFSKTDCPYCEESKGIFRAKGVAYETVELDTVENGKPIHDYLKGFTSQNTVPNIFIGKKHVGGCSDLKALDASGKLNQMLKDA